MKAFVTLNSDGSRHIEIFPDNEVEKRLLWAFDDAGTITACVEDTGGMYSSRDDVKRVVITIIPAAK